MVARSRELMPERSARDLFGAEMRRFREESGLTLERLGAIVGYSKSVISRVETADAMIPPDMPGALDATFVTGGLFQKLYALARKEIHPDRYRRRMELEERAVVFETFAGHIVPGLLQTEEYAQQLFRDNDPAARPQQIQDKVLARMSRKFRFVHQPGSMFLGVILDEAVLRRSVGTPEVMRDQLALLLDLVDGPHSVIQVLPFSHGGHALLGGTLNLMTLDDGSGVAWEESIDSGTLMEDKESVTVRRRAYDRVKAHALSLRESAALIRDAMEALSP